MKELDLTKTVADLVLEYPEVSDIMVDLGFKDITSLAALKFMGKVMTIPKGAAIKGIPMDKIITAFENKGFTVTGVPGRNKKVKFQDRVEDRNVKLKKMIMRLNEGEELEKVRADFVREFESV